MCLMELNCISWNVRGIESPNNKYVVKRFWNQHKHIDIMLIMEVKATKFILDVNLRYI